MKDIVKKQIPQSSGVYFFHDKNGKILYIGKAANLRVRVGSYLNKQPKDSRISKMLELAKKVDWQETESEIEALILESQLIKRYRPSFNVMLRDDKQYFYVVFTKERFPKIFLTHQPKAVLSEALAKEGPFTDGAALKTSLRLVRRIFPYCTCKQKHNNYCLNYHIGKCLGFCCLKNLAICNLPGLRSLAKRGEVGKRETETYKKNLLSIKYILEGKRAGLIKKLKKEMADFGRNENFDKAIELRDKIEKLEKVFENARIVFQLQPKNYTTMIYHSSIKIELTEIKKLLGVRNLPRRIEGYDVSNIQGQFATGSMVVFIDGQPDKNQYRKFKIKIGKEPNLPHRQAGDTAMLKEVLARRFNHPEWPYPDLIIVDGGMGQLNAALSSIPKNIPVVALTKNDRHRGDHIYVSNKKAAMPLTKLPEPARNLILQINAEAHRFAISYYRKLHRRLN